MWMANMKNDRLEELSELCELFRSTPLSTVINNQNTILEIDEFISHLPPSFILKKLDRLNVNERLSIIANYLKKEIQEKVCVGLDYCHKEKSIKLISDASLIILNIIISSVGLALLSLAALISIYYLDELCS